MTQRGGDESVKDSAALQELAAAVVHGVYRTVKACQFHTDVSNDAVTSLTASAANGVAEYCARAGTETVALSFLGDAIFVNRQIMKASRDTHALAAELRALLETCEVTELTFAKGVDRAAISAFAKLLADVQRDRSLVVRVTSGEVAGITAGKARFAASGASREESPGQRAARTYATSVLTVQGMLAEVRGGKFELPRKIKRVAQQVVARADEDARLLVALAATGGVSLDNATIAVGSAILAVAMTRQLTTDRALLTNAAMAALVYDVGRAVLTGATAGQRTLNDDELDGIPARTVVALTALGRMHAPARARTALLYEVWSMRRAHRLGPVYNGRRPPTLLARIIGVARAFAELRGAGADGGLSIDDALQVLTNRATEGTDRALVKLLVGALGIYPAGTMVTLNTGELGVVMGTPSMPLDYVRPPLKILYDAHANLLDTPVDIDLAAPPPNSPARFIAKSVDADEQQMKAMRAFVVAATAAKRRGALDPVAETVPPRMSVKMDVPNAAPSFDSSQARPTSPVPRAVLERPIVEATLQSMLSEEEQAAAERHAARQTPVIDVSASMTTRPPQVAVAPPVVVKEAPRRRDPRNDSAPPSSMQDEIHRPVRVARAPRTATPAVPPPPISPPPAAVSVASPPPSATRPAIADDPDANTRATAKPPPLASDEEEKPVSSRDELLAAFLADAPIDEKTEPPPPSVGNRAVKREG